MEIWDNDDYETAIEEYPGYLGSTWDGELAPGPHLAGIGAAGWITEFFMATDLDIYRTAKLAPTAADERRTSGMTWT